MVTEDPVKHLEFIQNVINRMANNSFLLKGWTVTLVAALFALAAQNTNPWFGVLAFLPTIAFWILDAYYLRQERLFRELYNDIRVKDAPTLQSEGPFSMNTEPFEKDVESRFDMMLSPTLRLFYITIIVAIAVLIIVIFVSNYNNILHNDQLLSTLKIEINTVKLFN